MSVHYDVIVIGAGPAGSVTARTLAQSGRNVLLIEKGSFPGRSKACGGLLSREDFREFDISEDIIEKKMDREISLYPWSRRIIHYPLASVNRNLFDEYLAMSAKHAGANLIMSCRTHDVKRYRSGDLRVSADAEGKAQTFDSKVVIFADGVNTLAHRTMGIGFRSRPGSSLFGLVYEFECPGNQMTDYYIFFNPRGLTGCGYAWVIPKKDTLNVGIYLFDREYRTRHDRLHMLEDYIDRQDNEFSRLLKGKRVLKKSGAYIPVDIASRFCSDSVLTVGDAAGLVSPLTGAGIHTALFSGRLAGRIVDRALAKKDFSQKALYEYESALRAALPYKNMKKELLILRFCSLGTPLDPYMYAKLFHLYKIRRDFSLPDNLKVAFFPFLRTRNSFQH